MGRVWGGYIKRPVARRPSGCIALKIHILCNHKNAFQCIIARRLIICDVSVVFRVQNELIEREREGGREGREREDGRGICQDMPSAI